MPLTGSGSNVEPRSSGRTLTSCGHTYYWRLGHHHNGTAHDLTMVERAIRGIGLGQSITPCDGLRSAHLPTRRQGQHIRHIRTHPAAIRADELNATPYQAGNLNTGSGGTRRNANHHRPSTIARHHEGVHDRLRTPKRFNRDSYPTATGRRLYRRHNLCTRGVYRMGGPEATGGFQFVITH